jgi:BASS family bile acid:Na+ symporter
VVSIFICGIQFGIGKLIGKKYGDIVAGGQMLGQKNSALGIWMANIYLNPLSSVSIALYSIWQNLFNSWQLYRFEKKRVK